MAAYISQQDSVSAPPEPEIKKKFDLDKILNSPNLAEDLDPDLRNAIGINDKYQFIQELFRGDRDLYERSIKTINECDNLQEADYWIQREIKIIQGWEDDHHLVQHFYSLLKKRFS